MIYRFLKRIPSLISIVEMYCLPSVYGEVGAFEEPRCCFGPMNEAHNEIDTMRQMQTAACG